MRQHIPTLETVLKKADTRQIDKLNSYINYFNEIIDNGTYSEPESAVLLARDKSLLDNVLSVSNSVVTPALKYVILIGIGGSNLGAKAVYDALLGHFDPLLPNRIPKILFVDTPEPKYLKAVHDLVQSKIKNPEELLICVVSKSGTTMETIVNLAIIRNNNTILDSRIVVISGEDSPLTEWAHDSGIKTLPIPDKVVGRYSILTAAGLLPLVIPGIDIEMLQKGAWSMVESFTNTPITENAIAQSALALYYYTTQGFNIHDMFVFRPELESLGKWYRQLVGESLGKSEEFGITPTVSVGTTDLHSVGQLYLGGKKDKLTTFVSAEHDMIDIKVPDLPNGLNSHLNIKGLTAASIVQATLGGVRNAWSEQGVPFIDVKFETISEFELGAFMQFKMIEIMLLAKLFDINAFDQPNVELYKKNTREILHLLNPQN